MKKLRFTLNDEFVSVDSYQNTYFLPYPCTDHSVCFPYISILPPGYYNIETWGAQGGTYKDINPGGKGGYSRGILKLNRQVKAYFYVGASGIITKELLTISPVAFNGGGSGFSSQQDNSSSGGGASDVRLIDNTLYHRLIVAGGGGGSGQYGSGCAGGSGGGNEGEDGMMCFTQSSYDGKKGTQTEGGITLSQGTNGAFGFGGNKTGRDGCGGGGGWFGGGAGGGYISAGAGGSGFVFNSSSLANARKQGLLLSNKFLLRDAVMYSGNEEFPAFKSFLNETGHSSNGAISITLLQYSQCTARQNSGLRNQSLLFLLIIVIKS